MSLIDKTNNATNSGKKEVTLYDNFYLIEKTIGYSLSSSADGAIKIMSKQKIIKLAAIISIR